MVNSNPQSTLHLGDESATTAGTLRLDSFVSGQFFKLEPGTNTLNIKDYHGTSLISFDGANDFVLMNGGSVGIGTTSPNAVLEVEDNGTSNNVILKVTGDDANPYGLVVGNDTFSTSDFEGLAFVMTNDGIGTIDSRGTSAEFRVRTGATPTEAMRIDSSGNLGIGTTSPFSKAYSSR